MKRILMLGWEFPPLFNGGLGIATYGIVKALCRQADIRLIIPSSSGDSVLPNVNVIGLNRISLADVITESLEHNLSNLNAEVVKLAVSISPYHHVNDTFFQASSSDNQWTRYAKVENSINQVFGGKEVYGSNTLFKVRLYATLAEEIASAGDFDLIHAHDWVTYGAGIKIKKRTGKPLILHVHALETDRAGIDARNEIYRIEHDAFRAADRIIAVSQYTKSQIVAHYGIDESRIAVVHNGIDEGEGYRRTSALRDKLVVFLGRITHQKGPQFLIETAEKVCKVYPRVKFVVAGTGDQFAHLLETSAYRNLGNKFIFAGFLSKNKVDELLSMADVYFMPSVSEPFGLTALEASQFQVPSVLSKQSGASEVLRASLKADFWDTNKYANYIFALLNYPTLALALSTSARQEIKSHTWDATAEKILSIYAKYN